MKSIKTLYVENKKKIIFVGCAVTAAVIGAITYKQGYDKGTAIAVENPYAGKSIISWIPDDKVINLEEVKEVLDLNADNNERFAIFKEGSHSDAYKCIVMSDKVL